METIHTDSAYKALTRKGRSGAVIELSMDQSPQKHERKIFEKPNVPDQVSGLKTEVPSCSLFMAFC